MRKYLILIFIPLWLNSYAQENKETKKKWPTLKRSWSVAYLGNNIWNPGINVRKEVTLMDKVIDVVREAKLKGYRKRQLLLNANLGAYWDPQTHVATIFTAGIMYRRTNKQRRQLSFGINPLGFTRTFMPEGYTVDDQGTVSRKYFTGKGYYSPEMIVGIGKIRKKRDSFLNLHFLILTKYNSGFAPQFNVEYGFRF